MRIWLKDDVISNKEVWAKEYPYLTYHWTSEHEFTLGTSSVLKGQHGGRENNVTRVRSSIFKLSFVF